MGQSTEPDLSEFEKHLPPSRQAQPCVVGRALTVLPEAERTQLAAALARSLATPERRAISAPAISAWLRDRQVEASASTVRTHRRKECGCATE